MQDEAKTKTICATQDFSSLDAVKLFFAPLFYHNDTLKQGLMNLTGMTQAQVDGLYATSETSTFGSAA